MASEILDGQESIFHHLLTILYESVGFLISPATPVRPLAQLLPGYCPMGGLGITGQPAPRHEKRVTCPSSTRGQSQLNSMVSVAPNGQPAARTSRSGIASADDHCVQY